MYNYKITTIGGIPIRVNISLLLSLPVLAWLIGSGVQKVTAETPAFDGVVAMSSGETGVAVVMDAGEVVGQITAASLGEFLQVREETKGLQPRVAA